MIVVLTLASASPRRRQLLQLIVPRFDVVASRAQEVMCPLQTPAANAFAMARAKAAAVSCTVPGLVLGADTIVCQGAKIFGKPKDIEENIAMLAKLSDRWHAVLTGVALYKDGKLVGGDVALTRVRFRDLARDEIRHYAHSGHGLDKAGGYGIQDVAGKFVAAVDGCYYNVVGLPLELTTKLLAKEQ